MKMKELVDKDVLLYKMTTGDELPVKTDGETVWMTVEQMVKLLGRTQSVISRHINCVFSEGELPKEGYMQILHKTSSVGGRPIAIYNLDVLISVGYRVKSPEGVRFRQWATRVLREMLLRRVEEVREIAKLKHRMDNVEGDIKQIKGGMTYLLEQLTVPEAPRPKIGFGAKPGETSTTPYGRAGRTVS